MTDARSHWSGYTAFERVAPRRWRFEYPDGRGHRLAVEVTFPDGYEEDNCFDVVGAIARGLDWLASGRSRPT
jgi:hypothetical protein